MSWLSWSMLSAVFAAFTAIFAKIGVTALDSNLATAIRTSVVVLFTWSLVLAAGTQSSLRDIGAKSWVFLTLSGLATGLSWLCYFRALQLGPASRVAPIDKMSVVFVILLAAVFLGEKLTVLKLIGGALIAAGAAVMAFA